MRKLKAFTLVELMVAMAIIGVLLGLAIFGVSAAQRAQRDTERKSGLQDLNLGIQDYINRFTRTPEKMIFTNEGAFIQMNVTNFNTTAGCRAGSAQCVFVPLKGAAVIQSSASGGNAYNGSCVSAKTTNAQTRYCFDYEAPAVGGGGSDGYALAACMESGKYFDVGTATWTFTNNATTACPL